MKKGSAFIQQYENVRKKPANFTQNILKIIGKFYGILFENFAQKWDRFYINFMYFICVNFTNFDPKIRLFGK